jgi:hypothetical protein
MAMDGNKHKEIIRRWFNSAVHDGGIDRFDDLHVDQIDEAWKTRSKWISVGLQSFENAREVRDNYGGRAHLTVVVAFALASESRPLGITFHNRSELENRLSSTPPSLYLFQKGNEFWTQAEKSKGKVIHDHLVVKKLDASKLFGKTDNTIKCIYMESLRSGDDEYSRDVFLAG